MIKNTATTGTRLRQILGYLTLTKGCWAVEMGPPDRDVHEHLCGIRFLWRGGCSNERTMLGAGELCLQPRFWGVCVVRCGGSKHAQPSYSLQGLQTNISCIFSVKFSILYDKTYLWSLANHLTEEQICTELLHQFHLQQCNYPDTIQVWLSTG